METAERQASLLRRERDMLRALLSGTQAQLAYLDPHFDFVAVNPAYAKGSGYTQEQLIGRNHFELFPDAENQAIFERIAITGETAAFHAKPFTFPRRPELGVTYWDWTLAPDKDDQGQVRGLVLSLVDVTERERAKRRGQAHLAQTETLITVLQQVLSATDSQGVQQAVVRAARDLTGGRIATSGHGYRDGIFHVSAVSHAPGATPCPTVRSFTMQRGGVYLEVLEKKAALRLTQEQLLAHPGWWGLPEGHAPLHGLLSAPLLGKDGKATGLIMVTDKEEGEFTGEDEALLTQLAALASLGLQHIKARDEAQHRAAELKATADAIPDGIVICDMQGNIVQANAVALKILGYSADEFGLPLAKRAAKLKVTGQEGEPVAAEQLPVSRALHGETVRDLVLSIQRDGMPSPSWVHASAALIRGEDGRPLGVVQSLSDLTPLRDAQRRLEAANETLLRQSQELLRNYENLRRLTDELQAERSRLRAVVDNAPVGIVLADDQSRIVMTNPAAERVFARPLPFGEPLESQAQLMQSHPDGSPYEPRDLPIARSALEGETCNAVDVAIQWPDGQRRLVRTDSAPIRDDKGAVLGAVGIYSDATERRRVAAAMSRYAQRLETLHRADQAILAGHSAEEVAEGTLPYIQELVPCERVGISLFDAPAGRVRLLAVAVSGQTRMPKGWTGLLSDTAWPADLAQGKIRTVEDLSSLIALSPFEATLLAEGIRSWTNVPLIVEGELIGALNLGTNSPGLLTPEQMEVMQEMADELATGLQQARLRHEIERYAQKLEGRVAARTAELQASRARLQAVFDGAAIGITLVNRTGQILEHNAAMETLFGYSSAELHGMALPHLVHPDDIDDDFAEHAWGKARASPQRRSLRMLRKDGELLWVNLDVSAIASKAGGQSIVMIEDDTAARQSQEKLIQSEKLAIAGRLAASLAHEINNPLQSVIGCLSLVEEAQAEGGDISRYLQVAREELRRAAGIVHRLRDVYTPAKPGDRKPTDVNGLIEGVLTLTQKRCEDSSVEVQWRPGKDLPSLKLVPGSMQQVFLNLVLNAVEAMPQGGRLWVSTVRTGRPAGVRVTIIDTGGGIPAEALPHLFQPFQTSKADGLGLGLFVTQRIVEEHGGRISVESRAGVGSTFRVWLPR
jgi:PAS domain S-box-containing protein